MSSIGGGNGGEESGSQPNSVVEELEDLIVGDGRVLLNGDEIAVVRGQEHEEEEEEAGGGQEHEEEEEEQQWERHDEAYDEQGQEEGDYDYYEPMAEGGATTAALDGEYEDDYYEQQDLPAATKTPRGAEQEVTTTATTAATTRAIQEVSTTEELVEARARIVRLEEQLQGSQELVADLEAQVNELRNTSSELQKLQQKIEILTEERDSVLSLVGEKSQELDLLTSNLSTTELRLKQLEDEVEALKKQAPDTPDGAALLASVTAGRDEALARVTALEKERAQWLDKAPPTEAPRDSTLQRIDDSLVLLEQQRQETENLAQEVKELVAERNAVLQELEQAKETAKALMEERAAKTEQLQKIDSITAERDAALQELEKLKKEHARSSGVSSNSSSSSSSGSNGGNSSAIAEERDAALKKLALLTVERDGAVERLKRQTTIVNQAQAARQTLLAERDKALADLKAQTVLAQQAKEGQELMTAENRRAWAQLVEKVRHAATLQTERDQLYELANEAEAARAALEKERDAAIQAQKALGAPRPRGALPTLPPGSGGAPAAAAPVPVPRAAKGASPQAGAKVKGAKSSPKGAAPAPAAPQQRSRSGSGSRGRRDTSVAEVGEKAPGRPMPMMEASVKPAAAKGGGGPGPKSAPKKGAKEVPAKVKGSEKSAPSAPAAAAAVAPTVSAPSPSSDPAPPTQAAPVAIAPAVQSTVTAKTSGSPNPSVRKSVRRLTLEADEAPPAVVAAAATATPTTVTATPQQAKEEPPEQPFLSLKDRMNALPVDSGSATATLDRKSNSGGATVTPVKGVSASAPPARAGPLEAPTKAAPNPAGKAALFAAVTKVAHKGSGPVKTVAGKSEQQDSPKFPSLKERMAALPVSDAPVPSRSPRKDEPEPEPTVILSLKERMAALPVQEGATAPITAPKAAATPAKAGSTNSPPPAKGSGTPSKGPNTVSAKG